MNSILKPLKSESLKEVFISRFEDLILTGTIAIGEKLPPERELAFQLGVSRPVVHEGLVELAARGLVTMKPRVGTMVNDFRKQGSLSILESLFSFRRMNLDPAFVRSLIEIRTVMEVETSRMAAQNRTSEQIGSFHDILLKEEAAGDKNIDENTRLDFEFHHLVSLASGNLVYPLLINSLKPVYTTLTSLFFADPNVVPETRSFHKELVGAIEKKDTELSIATMTRMLAHGEQNLKRLLSGPEKAKRGGRE